MRSYEWGKGNRLLTDEKDQCLCQVVDMLRGCAYATHMTHTTHGTFIARTTYTSTHERTLVYVENHAPLRANNQAWSYMDPCVVRGGRAALKRA